VVFVSLVVSSRSELLRLAIYRRAVDCEPGSVPARLPLHDWKSAFLGTSVPGVGPRGEALGPWPCADAETRLGAG